MTTIFHYEADEPRYESSYEGADLRLHCQGLVALAMGPEFGDTQGEPPTWYELSPANGRRVLAGVGRGRLGARNATVLAMRKATWAGALAGLSPTELVESNGGAADALYALVDPASGHVEIAGMGQGCSALIIDSCHTRHVLFAEADADAAGSASLELSGGSLLLLMTHDPSCFETLRTEIEMALATRVPTAGRGLVRLEVCIELRDGALSQSESVVALYFERPGGSPVARRPLTPAPLAGGFVRNDGFLHSGVSEPSKWLQQPNGQRSQHRSEKGSGRLLKFCPKSSKQEAVWTFNRALDDAGVPRRSGDPHCAALETRSGSVPLQERVRRAAK